MPSELTTIGSRIEHLLESADKTVDDLANILAVDEQVAQAILSDQRAPTTDDLLAIATFLKVPVGVLSGRTPFERHLGVSLRLGVLAESQEVSSELERAEIMLSHAELLNSWGVRQAARSLEGFAVSRHLYAKTAGKTTAQRLRDFLDLGQHPIPDMARLVEAFGVPVAFDLMSDNVHGISVRDERAGFSRWVILVNAGNYWTRQRFTLAHEWCHVLYADAGQVVINRVDLPENKPEWRAESFARHFLLPEAGLQSFIRGRQLTNSHDVGRLVADIMLTWGVSRDVACIALVDDRLVTERLVEPWRTTSVNELMSTFDLRDQWRDLIQGQHEPSTSESLLEDAVAAFADGLVDVDFVAELLGESDLAVVRAQLLGESPPNGHDS